MNSTAVFEWELNLPQFAVHVLGRYEGAEAPTYDLATAKAVARNWSSAGYAVTIRPVAS